ncbi:MAG: DUF2924 domain-containing protein [Planctomycetes bacterium]|nr:DUF2924 domain-containing protein [Planctomycetota bacterium]
MNEAVNAESLDEHLAALASMTYGGLAATYLELFGKVPRVRDRRWLRRKIAWEIQAREHGRLGDTAVAKLDEIIQALGITFDAEPRVRRVRLDRPMSHCMAPGTVIRKTWHGREIVVRVQPDGSFECDGTTYRTLSAVASAITSQHVNARLFFGLVKRKRR